MRPTLKEAEDNSKSKFATQEIGNLLDDSHEHTARMHMWWLVTLLIFGVVNSGLAQAANTKDR